MNTNQWHLIVTLLLAIVIGTAYRFYAKTRGRRSPSAHFTAALFWSNILQFSLYMGFVGGNHFMAFFYGYAALCFTIIQTFKWVQSEKNRAEMQSDIW